MNRPADESRRSAVPKKHYTSNRAPKPVGPYSQSVSASGLLFISGQIPIDPKTGMLIEGGIEEQTEQVLKNILAILNEVRMTPENVVKTTVYLVDLGDFARMNEVYARHLGQEPPARATVQVAALPAGARVEIEAIAAF
jgi:2-iminobutanoate/2-iminopropanoate deaminase